MRPNKLRIMSIIILLAVLFLGMTAAESVAETYLIRSVQHRQGLSTDTKPALTAKAKHIGATFLEIDTGVLWRWSSTTWINQDEPIDSAIYNLTATPDSILGIDISRYYRFTALRRVLDINSKLYTYLEVRSKNSSWTNLSLTADSLVIDTDGNYRYTYVGLLADSLRVKNSIGSTEVNYSDTWSFLFERRK